jgi:RNA polymerase sigma-70 factor (ECF subfamily)
MDGNSRKEFLKQLYMKQSKGMFRYANSIMRDNYLAEDAVQETFAVAWEKIESLVGMDSPVGWLFGTLKNIMKKNTAEMYKFQKLLLSLDGYNGIDQAVTDDIDPTILYEGIISSEEYSILEKLYIHGYTYKELASEMKVPLSTVGMKAKRAREKFRKKHGK